MTTSNYSVNFEAILSATSTTVAIGDVVVPVSTTDPTYFVATSANRGTRFTHGVARMVGNPTNTISVQSNGYAPNSITGLGAGIEAYARVSSTGRLERVSTVSAGDDIVGKIDGSGGAMLCFGSIPGATISPPTDYTTQAAWYINATTGSDTNSGATSLLPLATHAELENRIGGLTINPPADGTSGIRLMTVHIMTDLPESDPVNITYTLGQDCFATYIGTVTSTVRSGTLSAFTARSGNTAASLADGTNFSASDIGKRVRITSGARINAVMWVAKNNGSNVVRVSEPAVPGPMDTSLAPYQFYSLYLTNVTPQASDPYAIETMAKVTMGSCAGSAENSLAAGIGVYPLISIQELDFRANAANIIGLAPKQMSFAFVSCKFNSIVQCASTFESLYLNCHAGKGIIVPPSGIDAFIEGGLIGYSGTGSTCAGSRVPSGATAFLCENVLHQDIGILGCGQINVVAAGVCDSASTANNPGGHGVLLGYDQGAKITGGNLDLLDIAGLTAGTLWGSGNAGAGVYVSQGCKAGRTAAAAPTITGATDLSLAGDTKGRASGEQVGLHSTRITTSWANITTAFASGGFGGSAHNFEQDAHYVSGTVATGPLGGATFTTIVGQANKVLSVNAGETGFELTTPAGATAPGGSNKQVQYNNSSAFGGTAKILIESANIGISSPVTGDAVASPYGVHGGVSITKTADYTLSAAEYAMTFIDLVASTGTWTLTLPATAGYATAYWKIIKWPVGQAISVKAAGGSASLLVDDLQAYVIDHAYKCQVAMVMVVGTGVQIFKFDWNYS